MAASRPPKDIQTPYWLRVPVQRVAAFPESRKRSQRVAPVHRRESTQERRSTIMAMPGRHRAHRLRAQPLAGPPAVQRVVMMRAPACRRGGRGRWPHVRVQLVPADAQVACRRDDLGGEGLVISTRSMSSMVMSARLRVWRMARRGQAHDLGVSPDTPLATMRARGVMPSARAWCRS